MSIEDKQSKPGDMVVLERLPPGFLDDLPPEDQLAISEAAGKPMTFNEYADWGHAELEFQDKHGVFHFIYVDPSFIRAAK
jgi:hypothetical protein